MCERNGGFFVGVRFCGTTQFVGTDCGDALCPSCEPFRATERRKGWQPVAERMAMPMWTTMSLPNVSDADVGIRELMATRRRFLNVRLGSRNQKRLKQDCHAYTVNHFGAEDDKNIAKWDRSVRRFVERLKKFEKPPRMYDMLGRGFATLEVTYNPVTDDWHPHFNAITDSQFLPWVIAVVAWGWASGGRGKVVYIKRLENVPADMREVVKYVSKPWELPAARQDDLRKALRHKRRIWPLGKAKPVKVKTACPSCGSTECTIRFAGKAEILQKAATPWGEVVRVRYGIGEELGEKWFVKQLGLWKEPEPESLNLILRYLARHSAPAPPRHCLVGSDWHVLHEEPMALTP